MLAAFVAVWAFEQYRGEGAPAYVAAAIASLSAAGALTAYAVAFARRTPNR